VKLQVTTMLPTGKVTNKGDRPGRSIKMSHETGVTEVDNAGKQASR